MEAKELLLSANNRAKAYRILADCYYLPDEKLLERLHDSKELGELFLEITKGIPTKKDLKVLSVDFSRLFVGPFKVLASPYGSVYLENSKTLMGPSTIDARNSYSQEGLEISLKEAPDHIAIELEFMYFLCFKELEAIKNSNLETTVDFLKKQALFMDTHLCRWIPKFTEVVLANTKTDFYKKLARLSSLFIEQDLENISKKLEVLQVS